MNNEQFQGKWNQIKLKIKEKWNRLTDSDLNQINGKRDQLVNKLQSRYGFGKQEAESELQAFENSFGGKSEKGNQQFAEQRGQKQERNHPVGNQQGQRQAERNQQFTEQRGQRQPENQRGQQRQSENQWGVQQEEPQNWGKKSKH